MLKNSVLIAVAFPILAIANDCRVQDQAVSKITVTINERTTPRRDIISTPSGARQCQVRFRVRVGATWHEAQGQATWSSAQTVEQVCGQAAISAERAVVERIGQTQITQNTTMICDDDNNYRQLRKLPVGSVSRLEQYRLHPHYPGEFAHNGARCRWILDTVFQNQDVRTMQGVICQIQDNNWAVVDRF